MKKIKRVLMSVLVAAPVVAMGQPGVMNSEAAGYLERGLQMYESHNYAGAVDQLEHMKQLPADATMREKADYYIALSRFEQGDEASLALLQQFIERYPASPLAVEAQMKVGNYYFYRGQWESALLSYSLVRNRALDLNGDEDLEYRRAYSNLRLGNYREAERQYYNLEKSPRYGGASDFYKAYLDYAQGDYTEAEEKFSRIPQDSELGYQSQYYLAQIEFNKKRYNQVIEQGKALLAEHQNDYFDAELNRLVGESYYHLGNDTQARTYLRRYLDNPEGEPYRTAAYTMGVLDYRNGNYEAVVNDMLHVTDGSDALTQSAYLYMGQAKRQLGDLNGANMAFQQAATMTCDRDVRETAYYNYAVGLSKGARTPFDKSIDLFEDFLNEYPNSRYKDNVEGYLVDAYMSTTDYQRALESINHIKQPGSKVLKAKQIVLYNLGVQAVNNNRNSEAADYFKKAIAVGNYDKTALNESRLWLAETQYRAGNYKEAAKYQQEYIKAADKTDENYGLAQYNLGFSLLDQKRYAEAKAALQNAIASKQLSSELTASAYQGIGDAQYYARDFAGAQQSYDQAIRADKNNTGDNAMYKKAIMMGMIGQYADEIQQMDALIKAYPKSDLIPQAMLEKANAQAMMGKNSEALETYNALLKAYPKSVEARKGLLQTALVNKGMGKEDAAIEAYKKVIKQYPTSDEAQAAAEDMKLIYADRGQLSEFSKFLSSVPNAPKIDINEVERLTFEAAEKAAISERPSIDKLNQYIKDYPAGAYVPKARYYLARYHYGKGNYNEAMEALDQALQGGGDASYAQDAIAMRSDILMRQGKYEAALQSYKDLADRATSEDNRTLAQLGAMRVAKQMGNWNEVRITAATLLDRGGLTATEEKEVTLDHALALAQLGNAKDAETAFRALAKDPSSEYGAQASYELSRMQYELGNYKGAEQTVNALIEAGTPHNYWLAKSFLTLADVYYKQGNVTQAREYLQSLKSNYPGKEKEIFNEIDNRLNKWKGGNGNSTGNSSTDNGKKKGVKSTKSKN
ncbi:MAG: tetratricopeptide repeat protein [Muribaculaceae bacterium]|nr:tetratricopeptide repeat protein [Muribaculaceae bacterium]